VQSLAPPAAVDRNRGGGQDAIHREPREEIKSMRIRWRGLELPSRVIKDEVVSTGTYGRFIIEPFERGFGTTVGNSLRRILLSSLEGAAVTSVKIAGAPHEFTSLPGVYEDVTDIILNVKSLVVLIEGDEADQKVMKLMADKAGEVRASAIEAEAGVNIINTDHLICTLTDDVSFEMEMTVGKGRGYQTAEESEGPEQEIGVIPVDSVFSPVIRVRYRTEDTRVGQRTNYDRLILEVWTRGTILPEDAIVEAAKILRKHLNPFVQYYEMGEDVVTQAPPRAATESHVDSEMQAQLNRPISDLDLSVRASNCLESARVITIKDLARKTEADLLRVRSFGKTSLREVRRKLADIGLSLGMAFPNGTEEAISAPDSLATVVSTSTGVTTETDESGGTAEQEIQPVEVQADDSHREA
jgi:DNA-directed RNA polymerase subunit alpha